MRYGRAFFTLHLDDDLFRPVLTHLDQITPIQLNPVSEHSVQQIDIVNESLGLSLGPNALWIAALPPKRSALFNTWIIEGCFLSKVYFAIHMYLNLGPALTVI